MEPISVLISDFQYLTREGLIRMIEADPGLSLLGTVDDTRQLIKETAERHPNVLIMDYQSKDSSHLALMKEVIDSDASKLLIITNESKKEHIQSLLDLGIKGIVTKSCSKDEILSAIKSVSKDARFYCNRVLDTLMDQEEEKEINCDPTVLSQREYEVLKLITKGYKTTEIADELYVSVHTINSHRKNILKKLNLKSPTELIVYAMETGLVKI
ncbi:MAG: response regulator transcription factor [Cyclobacteriaceae bacterium]|nr:response regulator transcription factor [Cyclobacteriaceae bacterium SS2]